MNSDITGLYRFDAVDDVCQGVLLLIIGTG